ncbi:TetR/AcrR family transcriptional regulator [Lysinibacillus agricola]|uniref:TetR/AcrR family transcriptional regulator n=1 Tax=Lysinibacillus agricola TaxID=2590012 RepID=A0ABX7ALJ9_9BACI|nr:MULTISPECIES: TetR/AcrR family transcriptional regulator [Lysinibacillus]KOS59906.1 TetR family transcriptional regulator [Lysinibacillus sp. FJAT-14222]QQP10689.1 TetR/AcrR family transcriptional regulator [Lysinibacillus agricola]
MTKWTQRQERTRRHFYEALIQLIKQQGFQSITVKHIVERAGYNRSTFYVHFQDKFELAENLLDTMLRGLEIAVGEPYQFGEKVYTTKLRAPSFNIIHYIYKNRIFFELLNFDDTIPGLHTRMPLTITKIYMEQFKFETINNQPVNMEMFKHYTSYGFYGLMMQWITSGYEKPEETLIQDIIELTKTHIYAYEYIGKPHHDK